MMILISLFFFFITSKSGKIIGRYIKTSFKKDHTYTGAELAALSAAVKNTIKFILAAGGIGCMAGLMLAMVNLESKEMLGPTLALCFMSITYSIALGFFVFFPVQAWAENKINTLKGDAS
ncbi:MAG: hypothetical protein LBH42_09850 [Treponema sp.]|nr:hypothetical protein [Treponema sp.]